MQYRNIINNKIEPNKMGGFCIDLAHYYVSKIKNYVEYHYVNKRIKNTPIPANHLSGFKRGKIMDAHFVNSLKQFDYFKELPKELFSNLIAFEVENSIKSQLRFRKYIVKILENRF